MADIRITPASSSMAFTSSLNFKETLTQDPSGSIVLQGSGSTGRTNLFAVDGNNGRLFSIDDDLSNSLFSVNTIAGLPVIEAFADNTVVMGQYGQNVLVVTGSSVGVGTSSPIAKFHVSGSDANINGVNIGRGGGNVSTNISIGCTTNFSSSATGEHNFAAGNSALYSNTTGGSNTAIGCYALRYNTTGCNNTAIGYIALQANTTGASNTAIGYRALCANTTGNYNTAIGREALQNNTTGVYNTAIGSSALFYNTTGANNTAIGYRALLYNTTGSSQHSNRTLCFNL
jgi:hypothetical protein